MISVVSNAWALLLGMLLLMVGNGLQGTLLGVRGEIEQFSTLEMSVVMSAYFAGFLLSSRATPVGVPEMRRARSPRRSISVTVRRMDKGRVSRVMGRPNLIRVRSLVRTHPFQDCAAAISNRAAEFHEARSAAPTPPSV